MEVFFEIHSDNLREGPGDDASTHRALRAATRLPISPRVLDVGCGPGTQTLELARNLSGIIVAVDNHEPFLDTLKNRITREPLKGTILPTRGDMTRLGFDDESFDLVWAEGSIYNIGFERGLREWKRFLKPGGYVAVSEAVWLQDNPPAELAQFWEKEYPAMQSVDENCALVCAAGYELVTHFSLPEFAWLDNYYASIRKRLLALKTKYANDPQALACIHAEEHEIALYEKYSAWYGYEFYVMRKP